MRRWDWRVARAFAPAAVGLLVAYGATLLVGPATADTAASGATDLLHWLPHLALAAAALAGAWTCVRLWRVRAAQGLICDCGGLLGGEHGSPSRRLRTCRDCGRQWRVGRGG